jgi:hypothetical protein
MLIDVPIANTSWLGSTSNYGPWGQPFNGPNVETISFSKVTATYKIRVETSTQGQADSWSASISCSGVCTNPPPPPPPNCDSSCASTIGDTFSGSGWHVYNETLDFCDVAVGNIITMIVDAADVPNRFFITDANNTSVITTNWLGSTSNFGPWGSPFNGSHVQVITFQKVTETYNLRVETATQGQADSWSASISCQTN